MRLLNYFRVGSTDLWQGVPLRAAVRVDRDPQTREFPRIYLGLLSLDKDNERAMIGEPSPPVWVKADGRHLFELSTGNLPAGAYQIQLYLGNEHPVTALEDLWLLSRSDYDMLVKEQCGEEFLPSLELSGVEEVIRFVLELIQNRLRNDCFERDSPIQVDRVEGLVSADIRDKPFPMAPIEWTTERLVHAFRQLALFGVKGVDWKVYLTAKKFGLNVQGTVLEPFTEGLVNYLLDENLGTLQTINLIGDLPEFKSMLTVAVGGISFDLYVEHDVELRRFRRGTPSGSPAAHPYAEPWPQPRLDEGIEPPMLPPPLTA